METLHLDVDFVGLRAGGVCRASSRKRVFKSTTTSTTTTPASSMPPNSLEQSVAAQFPAPASRQPAARGSAQTGNSTLIAGPSPPVTHRFRATNVVCPTTLSSCNMKPLSLVEQSMTSWHFSAPASTLMPRHPRFQNSPK
ncbi:hypothetical protein TgHK011_009969 [Trichoderma gracile]|nr:hypothetical protein TgHK011_009969 [Trichoderma gracile]